MTALRDAEDHLSWMRKTASDPMDNARIVGFEDCLHAWKESLAVLTPSADCCEAFEKWWQESDNIPLPDVPEITKKMWAETAWKAAWNRPTAAPSADRVDMSKLTQSLTFIQLEACAIGSSTIRDLATFALARLPTKAPATEGEG